MSSDSDTFVFDKAQAHRFFAAECFNRTWELIDKPRRTPGEDEQMCRLAHASLWHWTQRDDCAAKNLSVGHWLLSRVYALIGCGDESLRYAEFCMRHAEDESPFYQSYAHEAFARAALVRGDRQSMHRHLAEARNHLQQVANQQERTMIEADLKTIQ